MSASLILIKDGLGKWLLSTVCGVLILCDFAHSSCSLDSYPDIIISIATLSESVSSQMEEKIASQISSPGCYSRRFSKYFTAVLVDILRAGQILDESQTIVGSKSLLKTLHHAHGWQCVCGSVSGLYT